MCVDFESVLKPVDEDVDTTQGVPANDRSEATCRVFQEHVPCSLAYKIVSFLGCVFKSQSEDAAEKFVCKLQQEAQQLFNQYIKTLVKTLEDDEFRYLRESFMLLILILIPSLPRSLSF